MSKERAPLAGRRVLIVEDRYLIATEMAAEVRRLGAEVVGPCRDVRGARQVVATGRPDLALLDVNLDGEEVYPLAEALVADGVPFVFLTGYDGDMVADPWRDRPRLTKPVDLNALRAELVRLSVSRG